MPVDAWTALVVEDGALLAELDSQVSAFEDAWPGDLAACVLASAVRSDIALAGEATTTAGEFWDRAGRASRLLETAAG